MILRSSREGGRKRRLNPKKSTRSRTTHSPPSSSPPSPSSLEAVSTPESSPPHKARRRSARNANKGEAGSATKRSQARSKGVSRKRKGKNLDKGKHSKTSRKKGKKEAKKFSSEEESSTVSEDSEEYETEQELPSPSETSDESNSEFEVSSESDIGELDEEAIIKQAASRLPQAAAEKTLLGLAESLLFLAETDRPEADVPGSGSDQAEEKKTHQVLGILPPLFPQLERSSRQLTHANLAYYIYYNQQYNVLKSLSSRSAVYAMKYLLPLSLDPTLPTLLRQQQQQKVTEMPGTAISPPILSSSSPTYPTPSSSPSLRPSPSTFTSTPLRKTAPMISPQPQPQPQAALMSSWTSKTFTFASHPASSTTSIAPKTSSIPSSTELNATTTTRATKLRSSSSSSTTSSSSNSFTADADTEAAVRPAQVIPNANPLSQNITPLALLQQQVSASQMAQMAARMAAVAQAAKLNSSSATGVTYTAQFSLQNGKNKGSSPNNGQPQQFAFQSTTPATATSSTTAFPVSRPKLAPLPTTFSSSHSSKVAKTQTKNSSPTLPASRKATTVTRAKQTKNQSQSPNTSSPLQVGDSAIHSEVPIKSADSVFEFGSDVSSNFSELPSVVVTATSSKEAHQQADSNAGTQIPDGAMPPAAGPDAGAAQDAKTPK
ncbi:hypothetical protein QOT17_015975 [Balamuthia mandrillaris]